MYFNRVGSFLPLLYYYWQYSSRNGDVLKLVLLGTGTPNAEPGRSGPSVAVIAGGVPWIVDCGPGIVRRANEACQSGISELDPSNLSRLLITHLHSDHTAGLPDILLTPWVLERKLPLSIWGPSGTAEMADLVSKAYSADIKERLQGLEPANDSGHRAEVTEIDEGPIYEDDNLRITAFRVNHGNLPAFGYRFDSHEKSVVVSGDTAPFQGMEEFYRDCDILVHEVYSAAGWRNRSTEWRSYHSSVHTSAAELAAMAGRITPGLIVLYHQLYHGADEGALLKEFRSIYKGRVVSGKDMDVFRLDK